MKIRSAVLEGTRNPGMWPVLRKLPKPHAREDSRLRAVALDAARRPSPPRPQRGPRRRRCPSPPSVPRPTPVPPRLGVFNRRPPPWFCGANQETRLPSLDPGVDATAAARHELRSRLPFTAVHRTVHRPQHLHGSSPSTLDARVPAIQRTSARSHRTVDNSLITSRIEYSTFLKKDIQRSNGN